MLQRILKILIVITSTVASLAAMGQFRCDNVFQISAGPSSLSNQEIKKYSDLSKQTHLSKDNFERLQPQIEKLAHSVLSKNIDLIANTLPPAEAELLRSGKFHLQHNKEKSIFLNTSPLHEIWFKIEGVNMDFIIRTNGLIATLSRSWEFRKKFATRHQGVAFINNKIESFDFGSLTIAALSKDVKLSRVMDQNEATRWRTGAIGELGSPNFGKKVHFALNSSEWLNAKPYVVRAPRSFLESLYERGLLDVNSYESFESSRFGLAPATRNEFGIEAEIVLFEPGIIEMLPYMQKAVPSH